jgi:hypothetical protein
MSTLTSELTGGDRRSIGQSNAVVGKILRSPSRFAEVIDGLTDGDPLIRMRCADAAEKVSRQHPEWLQPHKRQLLGLAKSSVELELRWHLSQMLPRLKLDRRELRQTEAILLSYLKDKSRIVQTFALQALADLSVDDSGLRPRVMALIGDLQRTGSPAVRARARKLLRVLKPPGEV